MAKSKRTNNDLHNIIQETNERATRTPLKAGMHSCAPEGSAVPAPHKASVVNAVVISNIYISYLS